MKTKYHDGDKYVFAKGKQYVAAYEIVEEESVYKLQQAVKEFLEKGYEVEGGMTAYTDKRYDKIWKESRKKQYFAQTLVLRVVERKKNEPKEKAETIVKEQ